METAEALRILNALANGVDPQTGEVFPPDSPYQRPDTIRALYLAVRALETAQPVFHAPAASHQVQEVDYSIPPPLTNQQQTLLEALRQWRNRKASELNLPAYIIAHNRMLVQIVQKPIYQESDLLQVKGFGETRVQKYGAEIMEILNAQGTPTAYEESLPVVKLPPPVPTARLPETPRPPIFSPSPPLRIMQEEVAPFVSTARDLEAARSRYPAPRYHPLLITEVTRMQNDFFCIAAYDLHLGKMARPLRPNGENWLFDEFQAAYAPGQLVQVIPSPIPHGLFPHRHEDMVLQRTMEVLETWTEAELYTALLPTTSETIVQLFGKRLVEDRYFPEGTRCPSLGGVQIARRCLSFHLKGGERLRLHLEDNDGVFYALPVTCHRLRSLFDPTLGGESIAKANQWLSSLPPDETVILRLGLTRGYAGSDNEFNPKRCYLQVNGILTASPLTPWEEIG